MRTYKDLSRLSTFEDRFEYLKLSGVVAEPTFGSSRYLNQLLYHSKAWREARREVLIRDNGCDLGVDGYFIAYKPIIHHMNPITLEQLEDRDPSIYDPELLICVSPLTHDAIHFGNESMIPKTVVDRKPNDTMLWTPIEKRVP